MTAVNRTLINISETAPLHKAVGPEAKSTPFLGIVLSIVIVLLLLAVMMFTREPIQRRSLGVPVLQAPIEYGDKYEYRGRKLLIRGLYLSFLSFLRGLGISFPKGFTPREVARVALRKGIEISSKISNIYYRFMYRPEEPPDEVVDEVERMRREIGDGRDEG